MSWWSKGDNRHGELDKRSILSETYFGRGTAELDEALQGTFVETDLWSELFKGHIDFVYGAKGAGKSALYFLLLLRQKELRKRTGAVVVGAENLRGEPVFQSLAADPDLDEPQLVNLWKLYFLTLVAQELRTLRLTRVRGAAKVIEILQDAKLLPIDPKQFSLANVFHTALRYVHPELALPIPIPAQVPVPLPELRIVFQEPTPEQQQQGIISINHSFQLAGAALSKAKLTLWIAIDRLDVAFALDEMLEARALLALLRAAADLRPKKYRVVVKIFLRTDIWDRITGKHDRDGQKLPEATSFEGRVIGWSRSALFDLAARRILYNRKLCSAYGVAPEKVLRSMGERQALFERIFPSHMASPTGDVDTFTWILSQLRDGTGHTAPRELILFLTQARQAQLDRIDVGIADLSGVKLFDQASLDLAATEVSKFRLDRTIYAEYPGLKSKIEPLRGGESKYTLDELARTWGESIADASRTAQQLSTIGFFALVANMLYIPPLYQRALNLIPRSWEEIHGRSHE